MDIDDSDYCDYHDIAQEQGHSPLEFFLQRDAEIVEAMGEQGDEEGKEHILCFSAVVSTALAILCTAEEKSHKHGIYCMAGYGEDCSEQSDLEGAVIGDIKNIFKRGKSE